MPDDLNPYEAPVETSDDVARHSPKQFEALKGPSLGLLLLSFPSVVVGMIAGLKLVACLLLWLIDSDSWLLAQLGATNDLIQAALLMLAGISNAFVFFGALCMRRGLRYRTAILAAIVASVPFLASCIWISIPFGVWALVILRRPAVRAAFQS